MFATGKRIEVVRFAGDDPCRGQDNGRDRQPRSLAEVEAQYLQETLATTGGNKTAAARI